MANNISLEEALAEAERHVEMIKAQWPGFYMIPTQVLGSDTDLDDFISYVNADGRAQAEKKSFHEFSADSGSFIAVMLEKAPELLPWLLVGFLAAKRKIVEIKFKDSIFRLENPDEKMLSKVLKFVERITIKDKD